MTAEEEFSEPAEVGELLDRRFPDEPGMTEEGSIKASLEEEISATGSGPAPLELPSHAVNTAKMKENVKVIDCFVALAMMCFM